jgi:serine/threonine protein kinase
MAVPARVGRYEIEVLLSQGPVLRVFLARDPALGRQVGVQALRDDLAIPAEALAEVAREVRKGAHAAASLAHPAINVIHDVGEEAGLGVFVVTELVRGLTLRERMTRGRLLRTETAALARMLGSALAYAHTEGVLHGHVRPDTVWLSPTGPKLVDFAMPTAVAPPAGALDAPAGPNATSNGPAKDARDYVAPEVLAGGAASARADQYALASCLYEAFFGKPPRPPSSSPPAGPSSAGRLRAPPVLLPELGGEAHVEAIFDCALAPDPRRRFPTCEVFGESLALALEVPHGTPPSMPTSQSSIVPRATRRWQNAIAGIAVLVIFALIGLGSDRHGAADGISLRSVARAFSASFGTPHLGAPPSGPSSGSERPRPP